MLSDIELNKLAKAVVDNLSPMFSDIVREAIGITPAQSHYLKFLERHKIKVETHEYISQNAAWARFNRSNVERWVKHRIVNQYKRPNKVEYKLSELTKAADTIQDYLYV